ncbi:MAG: methyltransferase domain-containing protein [Blautia sp.]|nr:methyltransferase domain-containing protein [Blautia sp.]
MKKEGYYSSGDFARKANITQRTIRYYDKMNLLNPSFRTEGGARFYTDEDFARLQQILLLKYLGFPLDDIREMTSLSGMDTLRLRESLDIQLKLIQDRIEQMQLVKEAILETSQELRENSAIDWDRMLELIHLTNMEKSMKKQYQNASNLSARIRLHSLYSTNPEGWFPWIFSRLELKGRERILEIGCGDGSLWAQNLERIPADSSILLTDISEGMLRDAHRNIGANDKRFSYQTCSCPVLPFEDESFDLVIANHVLFYCDDLVESLRQIRRILRKGGRLIASTYGRHHMEEITRLVKSFDERITLAATQLYESFGKENGGMILSDFFLQTRWISYEDSLYVTDPDALISYILSCHGNQNLYLLDRYQEFRTFVRKKMSKGLSVCKEAGVFICS